MSYKEH